MPRNNKVIDRVFADIVGQGQDKGTYNDFLAVDEKLGIRQSQLLRDMKEKYVSIVQDCKSNLSYLAALEEIISQIRCTEVIDSELRLSLSRSYIYARSTFFRRGKEINDIRVLMGKTTEFGTAPLYGTDLESLLKDTDFRALCKEKLLEVMNRKIEANVRLFNIVFAY